MRPASTNEKFMLITGGLGDLARKFYLTDAYELLGRLSEPTPIVCASHNPSTLDFFRFHPNRANLVLLDVGHIYADLAKQVAMSADEKRRRLLEICGLPTGDDMTIGRRALPMKYFHCADRMRPAQPYVVVHPFSLGCGNWPSRLQKVVHDALIACTQAEVYVISAQYITARGQVKLEAFSSSGRKIRVLQNLSAPAAFSLVASASRFIGNMSSLAQVAAFEKVPSIILYPPRYRGFSSKPNPHSRTILNSNAIARSYNAITFPSLRKTLTTFLSHPAERIDVKKDLHPDLGMYS